MTFLKTRLVFGSILLFGFSLFFFTFNNVFAACDPPHDYSSCNYTEVNPDYLIILELIEQYSPTDLQLQDFYHPVDGLAPQLTGLIKNSPYPAISNIYWLSGHQRPAFADLPSNYVPVTGFTISPGQQVMVPPSGYDISGGYTAMIVHLDDNSIVLKYTSSDNIVDGYTIYLEGINPSPELKGLYNQAIATGRSHLVAVDAFQALGTAYGEEIIVAIRDKGTFWDPRWKQDWWDKIYEPGQPLPPELIDLLNLPPPLVPVPTPSNQCSAGGSIPSSGTFRPYPCKNCTLNVPQETRTCADPFSVNAKTEWTCGSLERCGDGIWLKYASYGTNFSLDTRDTDVPFAGYHKMVTDKKDNSLNLHYYLADYIGGTALYDEEPYNPLKPKQVTKMINEAGVFRKLAPLEVQDKLRADMILSGHNYEITNGKIIKQMMDWWPEYPLPPKPYPAGHFPPLKSNPLYLPLYSAWLTTEWGRLWQRIPLFTREDSPGKITLTIEHYPGELYSANEAGKNKSPYSAEFPMAFPHLARLHDSSQVLQQMLVPRTHDNKQTTENKPENLAGKILLAQAKTNSQFPLLAQGDTPEEGNPPVSFELVIVGDLESIGGGNYKIPYEVKVHSNRPDRGMHARIYINDQDIFGGYKVIDQSWGPFVITGEWLPPLTVKEGESIDLSLFAQIDDAGELLDPQAAENCILTVSGGKITSNCQVGYVPPSSPTDPGCRNQSNLDPACSGNSPREDNKPNDPACCNADVRVDVNDYRVIGYKSDEAYQKACIDCEPDETPAECSERHAKIHEEIMSRKVQVDLKIPYLENIWEDTAEDKWGIFNIFRPADWPAFPDYDALSRIRYTQESPQSPQQWIEWAQKPVWLSPSEGNLYFPYLGGIQQSKKCIAEHFLLPPELQSEVNYCQFWDEYLKNQPTFDPSIPTALDPADQLDLMNCQNKDFEISSEAKQSAIATADNSWPNNLLEERWDYVSSQSKNHGWNPACVIALWIEESGGSDFTTTGAKYSLGCEAATSPDPSTNLDQSLVCFFSRQDHPYYKDLVPGSREWWLVYAEGPNNNGVFDGPQANFPKNLFSWYKRLIQ